MACNGYTRNCRTVGVAAPCPQTTKTYAQCGTAGSGAQCKGMYDTATQEKGDIQGLNDRLANYLGKLQGLQRQTEIDPASYRDAIANLEREIGRCRQDYENELNRLRKALEDCCREKNNLSLAINSNNSNVSELQGLVNDLKARLQKALAENQDLLAKLAAQDKEKADLCLLLQRLQGELDNLKPNYKRLQGEADDYKRRLDAELKLKADSSGRLEQALAANQFDNANKDKLIGDLQSRLKAMNDIILSLETKIKQITNSTGGDNLAALLQKIRDGTAAEIQRQQAATQKALDQALSSLKCQLDTDSKDKSAIQGEKNRLQNLVQQLQAKLSEMDGRLTTACTENQALKAELERERTCGRQEVANLEQKLQELHAQMMARIKECSQARDQQVALNAEIGNYKSLLDAVDSKIQKVSSPGMGQTVSQKVTSYSTNYNRPSTTICQTTTNYSRSSSGLCQPMAPAQVLGKVGTGTGQACCGSCATGGGCESGSGGYPSRTRNGTLPSLNNGYGTHSRSSMGSRTNYGTRPW